MEHPGGAFLESWSDARAYDGTVTIIQPLIAPLYDGKTAHEVLAAFTDQPERTSYNIVRDYWRSQMGAVSRGAGLAVTTWLLPRGQPQHPSRRVVTQTAQPRRKSATAPDRRSDSLLLKAARSRPRQRQAAFEQFWRKALHDGLIPNTQSRPKSVSPSASLAPGFRAPHPFQPAQILR